MNKQKFLLSRLSSMPMARAFVKGNADNPNLSGIVDFYTAYEGTLLVCEFSGLPYDTTPCANNIHALHIHQTGDCESTMDTAFMQTGGHYNPTNCLHPAHAGDLPPLFSNHGFAFQVFYTERFQVADVVGRAVIVHAKRDDFTSQPSGDAGDRIGCGVISRLG